MQAIILAAGKGTRLLPLTQTIPKVLLPIVGKPFIEHIIDSLLDVGFSEEDILIVTNYLESEIKETLKNRKVKFIRQKKVLGTANAVKSCKEYIEDDFLVINGDVLVSSEDLKNLLSKFRKTNALGMVGLYKLKDAKDVGFVEVDNERVKVIVEKEKRSINTAWVNGGVYVFKKSILTYIDKTKLSKRGEYEITDSIQLAIENGEDIYAYFLKEWYHLSYPWNLLEINEKLMKKKLKTEILGKVSERTTITGNVYIGKNTEIKAGSYIEGPVYIGDNCEIGPNCYIRPYSVIMDNCRIGQSVEIKNSIIMQHTNICHLAYVGDSIIGRSCNFGAGTKIANLRFDNKTVKVNIKGKKVDSKRRKFGAIIADNVKTGINVSINAGVKIGPNCWIYPHAVVMQDIGPNTIVSCEIKYRIKKLDLRH